MGSCNNYIRKCEGGGGVRGKNVYKLLGVKND